MKIDNVAFNLTSKDLTSFGLTLKDNDANGILTIGDDVELADKTAKHVSENDLTTWDGVISLLESGGTQVVKSTGQSENDTTYLVFGKTKLDGTIKLGTTSEDCNIQSVDIRNLAKKWPALAYMIIDRPEDAYQYQRFDDRKKVSTAEANQRIADTMSAAHLMALNNDADERLGKTSTDFLNGSVDSYDISFLVSARKSFDESVARYISAHLAVE